MLEGRYKGRILSPKWLKPAGLVWRGKVFEGDKVINLIGPFRLIRGKVEQISEGYYTITYLGGLVDELLVTTGDVLGQLRVFGIKIVFSLTKG